MPPLATPAPVMTPAPVTQSVALATPVKPAAPVAPAPMTPATVMSTVPKTVSPSVLTAQPAIKASQATIAKVNEADQQMKAQAAAKAAQPGSTALATLPSQQQISPATNAQGLTVAQMVAKANGQPIPPANTPPQASTSPSGASNQSGATQTPVTPPPGWDAQTYANFKAANPTLEPTAEDTALMQSAGTAGTSYASMNAKAAADFQANSQANYAALEQAHNDFVSKVTQIENGTFPLTPDQQDQINNIKADYQRLIDQQTQANTAYEDSVKVSGVRSGRDMYAPRVQHGNIQAAVSAGVSKIADLNSKMASAITTAKQAIKDDNLKLLSTVYDSFEKLNTAKTEEIKNLYSSVKDTIDAAQKDHTAQLEDAKFAFDVQQYNEKPLRDLDAATQSALAEEIKKYPDAGISLNDTLQTMKDKILSSKSYADEQAKAALDRKATEANIEQSKAAAAASRASAAKSYTETKALLGGGDSGTGTTPLAAAAQAIINGTDALSNYPKRSTAGQLGWAQVHEAVLALQPNFDFAASETKYKGYVAAGVDQSKTFNDLKKKEDGATANLDNLQAMNEKLHLSGNSLVASSELAYGKIANKDVKQYESSIEEVRAQAATILGGGSVTDQSRQQAERMLPANVSPEQMKANVEAIKALMRNKVESYNQPTSTQQSTIGAQSKPAEAPPAGQIWISRNGTVGSIPAGEFDPKTDKKL